MGMSEYERQRAANIARNKKMLAQLGVKEAVQGLKLPRPSREKQSSKGYKPEKKRATEESTPLRRSLRNKGIAPEVKGLTIEDPVVIRTRSSQRTKGVAPNATLKGILEDEADLSWDKPVPFSKVRLDVEQADLSVEEILKETAVNSNVEADRLNPKSLKLEKNDVARVVPARILSMTFLPATKVVIAASDNKGHIGIWDADNCEDSENAMVQVYQPHTSNVSTLANSSLSPGKIASCSYDGSVLLMDLEKLIFSRIYSGDQLVTSMCYPAEGDGNTIYIGEGDGRMKVIDLRSSLVSSSHQLHEKRVQTIDCCAKKSYDVATASTDGTVSIWDVRNMTNPLATMSHHRTVHSAYFSPSGDRLVTTSYDDHVGLWSGKENDDPVMINHNNQTNRWIATFRAIWSCSDNYVFIASMGQAIDVISTRQNKVMVSLQSDEMRNIPSRLAQHRVLPGVVAGGGAGGKVFLWRS